MNGRTTSHRMAKGTRYMVDGIDQYDRAFFHSLDGHGSEDERWLGRSAFMFWQLARWHESYSFSRMPAWLRKQFWSDRLDRFCIDPPDEDKP